MSLINEALKKAQHQRTGSGSDAPPMPGGGSGAGRGSQGMPKGTLMLLIAGAAVVVVISVGATVYFVNRAPAPKIVAEPAPTPAVVAVPAPTPVATSAASAPSPVMIAPVIIKVPAPVVELPSAPPPVVDEPAPAPAVATATPTPAPEPVAEGTLEERIATYVDKVRVTGIRTSENGSKVLMNDRVYRLNDVVDRKLGLKLVKIDADSLTFADASGATYVKNF